MHFLVTGGAGYIGSHFVKTAIQSGHSCTVVDDFSTGHEWAVHEAADVRKISLLDSLGLKKLVFDLDFDVLVHFASSIVVSESEKKVLEYYQNNFISLWNLLSVSENCAKIRPIIFSSTAAIFGGEDLSQGKLRENSMEAPQSVYGRTKLFCEKLLKDYAISKKVGVISLRYFNACGADPSGEIGEAHHPETHLIPNLVESSVEGKEFTLFGNDYPTRDGSCVRDYVHVCDLADAHLLAAQRISSRKQKSQFECFNLGLGEGFTNFEVLQSVERVVGKKIQWKLAPRRDGDAATLICDPSYARSELGFDPRFTNLDDIVKTAVNWYHKWSSIRQGLK